MFSAVSSQGECQHEAQKPAVLKTSTLGVIVMLSGLGCGTTPIDTVVAERGASVGDAAGAAALDPQEAPVQDCVEPSAGRFVVSGDLGCLRRGGPTTVFGNAALSTELSADCSSTRAQWDLTPGLAGTFRFVNVESQLSLDVRAAGDSPGTAVILYEPNSLDNQRFWLRERGNQAYELSPRHAPSLCAEARDGGVEIWPCTPDVAAQAFRFAKVACP